MKKRTFIKNLVLGGPTVLLGPALQETTPEKKWWRNKYEQFANITGEHRIMKAPANMDGNLILIKSF